MHHRKRFIFENGLQQITLMSIRKLKGKDESYKIVLVGDNGVGKTALFKRFVDDHSKTPEKITTVDFRNKVMNLHDKQIVLSLWDTAGQEKFRTVIASYLKSSHGVFLVFDLGNRASWNSVQTVWFDLARKSSPHSAILLIGNKTDTSAVVPRQEIERWCKEKQVYYIPTSATEGFQVNQSLTMMAALVDKNRESPISKGQNEICFDLNEANSDTKSSSRRDTRDSTMAWHNGSRTFSLVLQDYNEKMKPHQYSYK